MSRCCFSLLLLALPAPAAGAGELLPPARLTAGGRPLDVQRDGHSAPFVGDFDGDGKRDLLVGQFHEGRLRVYRNTGTDSRPKFDSYAYFQAGGAVASVPVG